MNQSAPVIFITGATSGFGQAIATRFAEAGWLLVLTGRRLARLQALQATLGGESKVHILAFDITDKQATESAIKGLPAPFSAIHVLINNAGLALGLEPAQSTELTDWETMVDTNIKGLMRCTHQFLPSMCQRKQGYIINIGSIAGNWPYPGGNVYCASKAFVRQFSLALRADLLGTGVRVTNIEPGNAETEFSMVRFKDDSRRADQVYADTDALTAQDIADTVWWLVNTPQHVNVTTMEIMPTHQATGPLAIHRQVD
ncbi:short-chain dehydrogenase/reductase SDR [Methylophaga frappieri]|uniref:Short-chain dehydrogenase/reductase SDR n=1 Tax=Methylophaga frappieri (strain ATCC BAA-2434 / DSM 25690 / JAM7) TaxID=754477 RepID=I1YG22_METFJ|nr:SDR family oxidoreductase [Methylophaga frappieri]AFJ01865.1 short-chain dehydrogenase/reductase SDR [Methylophaga frappieri]